MVGYGREFLRERPLRAILPAFRSARQGDELKVQTVIKNGLEILGVSAPERM